MLCCLLLHQFSLVLCSLSGTQALVDNPLIFDSGLMFVAPEILVLDLGCVFCPVQLLTQAPGAIGSNTFVAPCRGELRGDGLFVATCGFRTFLRNL